MMLFPRDANPDQDLEDLQAYAPPPALPRDWVMGSAAMQDDYRPYQGSATTGATPWKRMDIEAARGAEPVNPALPAANETLVDVAGGMVPSSPWEIGLLAAPGGAIGRGVAKVGGQALQKALVAGGIVGTADDAQAGVRTKIAKALTGAAAPAKTAAEDLIAKYANPKLREKAERLQGTWAKYAQEYPETGPPQLIAKRPDPEKPGAFLKTGGTPVPYKTMEEALAKDAEPGYFLEKQLLPEVDRFRKDRLLIQEDMDVHGYAPYFDPAKRFDVDPKHYGPFTDTGTAAAPATAKTDAEWYAKYGTPENRAKLQAGFEKGQTIPESDRWYLMGQLEKEYIKELGPKVGREAFKREFADMMAATTGGAAPYDNFLMSHYANVVAKGGDRLPERSYQLPFPIGGRYASGNMAQAQKYLDEGQIGFAAAANPKRYDFSSAFLGNKNAATIDEQMYQALRPTTTKASVNLPEWYGPATRVAREEAVKAGYDPRAFQDTGWAGLKSGKVESKGQTFDYEGPMINQINRSIETTHRLTGMPREEIVRRGLVRKEIPMYGIPALVGAGGASRMGGVAAQDAYEQ